MRLDVSDLLARVIIAREWLEDGDDLEADSVLRDIEHDLAALDQHGGEWVAE